MNSVKVDVIVLTKNSEPTLEKCLDSIYENVPVNRLIAIDGFSTDGTLSILRKYREKYGNVVIVSEPGTRATARQRGIELVETEWFMFVDSDVVLCKDWFKKAEKLKGPRVGAIWGVDIPSNPRIYYRAKALMNAKNLTLPQVMRTNFRIRGGTHDILIRTDAVKGIKIPKDLHVYEDTYIKEWIEKRGYKTLAAENPYCEHHRWAQPYRWTFKSMFLSFILEIRYGLLQYHAFRYLVKSVILALPRTLLKSLTSRDKTTPREEWDMYYYMFLVDMMNKAENAEKS